MISHLSAAGRPCGQIFPLGGTNTLATSRNPQRRPIQTNGNRVVEAPQNLVGHSKMPLLHLLQAISSTCPVGCSGNKLALGRPRPPRDSGKLATFQNKKLGPPREGCTRHGAEMHRGGPRKWSTDQGAQRGNGSLLWQQNNRGAATMHTGDPGHG